LTLSEPVGYTEARGHLFNAGFSQWANAIQMVIALILSVAVHEFGHAWAANRLGDTLPRLQGRLTLNPIRHIDPVGTIIIPLLMYGPFGGAVPMLGWGKPVQTNPMAYTRRLPQVTGSMLVAIAGPAMNLILALVISLVFVVCVRVGVIPLESVGSQDSLAGLIQQVIVLNISLLFLNLIPIPPLDGGSVLAWVLPRSMQSVVDFLFKWGFIILVALLITNFLRYLMIPATIVTRLWMNFLSGLVGA
jgi:Zn-dependent protease